MSTPPRPASAAPDLLSLLAKYFELREQEDEAALARRQITRQILEMRGRDLGVSAGRALAEAAAREAGKPAPGGASGAADEKAH